MKEKRERGMYASLLAIAIPIALQNLINNAVSLTDTVMVATLGETAVSAVSLSGKYTFIFSLMMFGIISGSSVLASQYWGRKDMAAIVKVFAIALKLAMILGLIFTALAVAFPRAILRVFTNIPEIIDCGEPYLRIVGASVFFGAVSQVFMGCMRSVERVKAALVNVIISFFVNLIVNAVLIFGLFGFPKLGIIGAAIGVLSARLVEFVVTLIYARCNNLVRIRFSDIMHTDRLYLRDLVHYSTPVFINETMWGLGISMHGAIYGRISTEATAANNIVSSVQNILTVAMFGVASAASVIVGKAVGQNRFDEAKKNSRSLIVISLIVGLFCASLVLITRMFILDLGIFNVTEQTAQYIRQMMIVSAVICVSSSLNTTMVVGILRGGGDTKFAAVLDLIFLWLFSLPLGVIVAFVLKAPVIWVMVALSVEEVCKMAFGLIRYRSGHWMRNLTR